MNIYIVGNSLVPEDNGPILLLPKLRTLLPECTFIEVDPNENFIPEEDSLILDTVSGIQQVQLFDDINVFTLAKSVSMHDFDLSFHLKLLDKLHKLPNIHILGIPQHIHAERLLVEVVSWVRKVFRERGKK